MPKDLKNLSLAILLSTLVLVAWQFFYESPRRERLEHSHSEAKKIRLAKQTMQLEKAKLVLEDEKSDSSSAVGKIIINTDKVQGSVSLKGLRFDALELKKYKESIEENSPLVSLLSAQNKAGYFAEFGWVKDPSDEKLMVPDKNTIWHCDAHELTANKPVSCYWNNGNNIDYFIKIALDDHYLFTISQAVENNSQNNITLTNYARIYKAYPEHKQFAILHEGVIGVFSDVLKESTYEDLSKERQISYTNTPGSWAGITNKYWLTALMPDYNLLSKTHFIATTVADETGTHDSFNVNYMSQDIEVVAGAKAKTTNHFFAGAKEEKLLEFYAQEYKFSLFDRAIDYGIFYFITKPLLWLISYFYSLMGNFGLAIIGVTFVLKLLMYPLANKSYTSMSKMKELQPKIEQLKNSCGDDKLKFNQEIMALYKHEKVSPAAGCLPLLIQIPLFFSLYKVIFISIEMRHAPFYGWIKDLSAEDPTSIWNLFGLLPWNGLGTLDIGVWPLIMGFTMFIQQKLSPAPADPTQAMVMKFMPILLVFMLYSLPSGLMIYWAFSNVLSIFQQYIISKGAKNI